MTALEPLPGDLREGRPLSGKALRWLELGLVLGVAFGSPIFNSVLILRMGTSIPLLLSGARWEWMIFEESVSLLLLGYVLHRRGLRIADLGTRWTMGNVLRGALLAAVGNLAYWVGGLCLFLVQRNLHWVGGAPVSTRQLFGHASWIMLAAMLLNPFFEELIVRAYLMTEVRDLTGSTALAVLLSWAVQTSYHLYYGWMGALAIGFSFLVFSLYYARTRRATPIIVAHGLMDMVAFLWLR